MEKVKCVGSNRYWKRSKTNPTVWDSYNLTTGKCVYYNDFNDNAILAKLLTQEFVIMTEDEPVEKVEDSRWFAAYLSDVLIVDMKEYGYFWIGKSITKVEIQKCHIDPSDKKSYKRITNKSSVDKLEAAFGEFCKVIAEVGQKEHLWAA